MEEHVFNLFAFVTDGYVRELGAAVHQVDGSDSEKLAKLQSEVASDAVIARRFPVPGRYAVSPDDQTCTSGIHYRVFQLMVSGGRLFEIFDEVLDECKSASSPMVCLTNVVDGEVRIDRVDKIVETKESFSNEMVTRYPLPNYALVYSNDDGFDLPRLLHDDYFHAIKLLYRERLFVSAAKLLMSFVDTVAFLHEGDCQGNFQRWLDTYVALASLGVTADELWELRNSLLHMTNMDSRKVLAGRVQRLLFFVGTMPDGFASHDAEAKYLDLFALITAVVDGVQKWVSEFNQVPAKTTEFFERYDRILSDIRYEVFTHVPIDEEKSGKPESSG